MKLIVSVALAATMLLAAAPAALAQEGGTMRNGLGLYASNLAGSGLTYAASHPSGWGYHVSGIGWGQGGSTFVNVGGAVTKVLDHRDWGSLYGLVAVGAGLGGFFGGSGLAPSSSVQFNVAPGLGFAWGPLFVELGYSVFANPNGVGFGPGYGGGLMWWF